MNFYKIKIMTIALIAHIVGAMAIMNLFFTNEWSWLLYSLLVGYVIAFAVECGWHRLITHRSYETSIFWERLLGFIGVFNGEGSPTRWAAIHRQHHLHSDHDENDPYPFSLGLWRMWSLQHNEPKIDRRVIVSIARDRAFKDPFFKWLDNYFFEIHLLVASCLWFFFGFEAFMYFYALPVFFNHIATVVIVNYVGHMNHLGSYRPYDTKDKSVNTPWIHFPWISPAVNHNTHHGNQKAWDITGEKWWEFDIYALFIKFIRKSV